MHRQRAQMVVEFAFVAPVLILLTLGILGIGRAFYTYVDLTNAARAGARYAVAQTDVYTCPTTTAFKDKVKASQPNIDWTKLATSPLKDIDLDCAPKDAGGNTIGNARRVTINYQFDTTIPKITTLPFIGTVNLLGVIPVSTSATLPVT